jgi:UTP:GlnB (protein PII) uridylyltransferase
MALIQAAKIMTIGERAEDTFYIMSEESQPLDNLECEKLRAAVIKALDR